MRSLLERGRWARAATVGAALLLVSLLFYGLTTAGTGNSIDRSLAEGRAPVAPAFSAEVLQGAAVLGGDGELELADLKGVPVVLNLWASWCAPCREEAPILEQGWRQDRRSGVIYLGLNTQDLSDDARDFLAEEGVTYPIVRETEGEIADAYQATGIPETFFISDAGRIVGRVRGALTESQLAQGVVAARRGEVLGTLTGGDRRLRE